MGKALSMSSSSLEECRWCVLTWESTNQSGNQGKLENISVPPKPKLLPGQELPQGIPGTSSAHGSALLKDCYGICLWKCLLLCLEAFFSKTRKMRRTGTTPFSCEGKASRLWSDQLTKSTVFLRFVSVSVSPTKLSHLPLQSSGSPGTRGTHKPWDLGVLNSLGTHLG